MRRPGAYLGFGQGGCTFLADLHPPPPPGSGSGSGEDFELDPDPHQNNADPQLKRLLSNLQLCLGPTKEQQTEEKCCNLCFLMYIK